MKLSLRLLQLALLGSIVVALSGCGGSSSFNFIPRDNATVNLTIRENGEDDTLSGSVTGETLLTSGSTLTATISTTTSDETRHRLVLRLENTEGDIAAGQNFTLSTSGPNTIVYTQTPSEGGEKMWAAKGGTIRIESIEGNQVTLRLTNVTAENGSGETVDEIVINGTVTLTYVEA